MEITEYNEFEAKITSLEDTCNFIPECKTEEGYDKSKRVSLDVGRVLTALEKKRKEIKAPALERCKFIDSEAKSLKDRIEAAQLPHKEAYKFIDDEKKLIEHERSTHITNRVNALLNIVASLHLDDSATVGIAIDKLIADEFLDCDEKTGFALIEKKRILLDLQELMESKFKSEKDAEELVRLKAESEARERKDREEAIAKQAAEDARIAAEKKAATEKAAIEKAEQDAREAADLAEKREKEAVERAAKQKLEAEQAAKQAAIDAEKAAKAQAEQAAADERKRIADETAANLAAAQKREADKKHHAKINNESLADFIQGGMDEEQARMAVTLLAQKKIRHAAISY